MEGRTPGFSAFRSGVFNLCQKIGSSFTSPDSDWLPVVITSSPDRAPMVISVGEFFLDESGKDYFARVVLPTICATGRADKVAWISSAWTATLDRDSSDSIERSYYESAQAGVIELVDLPAYLRREVVMLHFCDGVVEECWEAEISRSVTSPPILGEFVPQIGFEEMRGRFARPLLSAMELVQERGADIVESCGAMIGLGFATSEEYEQITLQRNAHLN